MNDNPKVQQVTTFTPAYSPEDTARIIKALADASEAAANLLSSIADAARAVTALAATVKLKEPQ